MEHFILSPLIYQLNVGSHCTTRHDGGIIKKTTPGSKIEGPILHTSLAEYWERVQKEKTK